MGAPTKKGPPVYHFLKPTSTYSNIVGPEGLEIGAEDAENAIKVDFAKKNWIEFFPDTPRKPSKKRVLGGQLFF